jgi:hypothetical protein
MNEPDYRQPVELKKFYANAFDDLKKVDLSLPQQKRK